MTREAAVPSAPQRIAGLLPSWWFGACVLSLLIASDYRFRTRDVTMALSGRPDIAVVVEVGVYASVALVACIAAALPGKPHVAPRLLYAMWAAAGTLAASALYSPFGTFAVVRGAQLVVVVALAHLAASRATLPQFALLVRLFTVLVGVSVVVGLLFPIERAGAAGGRFSWLYVHPVVAGLYLALAILFLVGHLTDGTDRQQGLSWPRPIQWTLLIVCSGGLLATQTRGSIGAAVVGCLVLYWSRSTPSQRIDLLFGGAVALALISLVGGDYILDFLQRGESLERIATLNARTDLWAQMLGIWAQRPLFGNGLGASRGLLLDETGLGGGHNVGVNLLVDAGAVGLVLWIVLFFALIRYLLLLRRIERTRVTASTLLGAVVLLLVNGLTTEELVVPATIGSTWMFIIVAWTLVLARDAATDAVAAADP